MPTTPLPEDLERFLAGPRRCVLATVRPDGSPATVPCWYEYVNKRVMLSMASDAVRLGHMRRNPHVALTMLGEDWYNHLSLLGSVVDIHEDGGLETLDRLSMRYFGTPYPDRGPCVVAAVEIASWHTFGSPGNEA